jgi:hypothetical protein
MSGVELFDGLVDFPGRYTRFGHIPTEFQSAGHQFPRLAHQGYFPRRFEFRGMGGS